MVKLFSGELMEDTVLDIANKVFKQERVWSKETGPVSTLSCQEFIMDIDNEAVKVLLMNDKGFADDEQREADSLKLDKAQHPADVLTQAYMAASESIVYGKGIKRFEVLHRMLTKAAIVYYCAIHCQAIADQMLYESVDPMTKIA
ncbi:MAG: hypothetical protein ACPGMR_03385 [Pontibacterium sp.]